VSSGPDRIAAELAAELDVAEAKAWDSLSRYKFMMFGYWAAMWVHLNRIGRFRRPNPWVELVKLAIGHRSKSLRAASEAPLLREQDIASA
jgi:hypothetical protein